MSDGVTVLEDEIEADLPLTGADNHRPARA